MQFRCGNPIVRELMLHCLEKNGITTTSNDVAQRVVYEKLNRRFIIYDVGKEYNLISYCVEERRVATKYQHEMLYNDYSYCDYIVESRRNSWMFQRLFKMQRVDAMTGYEDELCVEKCELIRGKELARNITIRLTDLDVEYTLTRLMMDRPNKVAYYAMTHTSLSANDLCCPILQTNFYSRDYSKSVILEQSGGLCHDKYVTDFGSSTFAFRPKTFVVTDIKMAMDVIWGGANTISSTIQRDVNYDHIQADDIESAVTSAVLRYTIETYLDISVPICSNVPMLLPNFVFLAATVLEGLHSTEWNLPKGLSRKRYLKVNSSELPKVTLEAFLIELFSKLIVGSCKSTAKKIGQLIYDMELREHFNIVILAAVWIFAVEDKEDYEDYTMSEFMVELKKMFDDTDKTKLGEILEKIAVAVESRMEHNYEYLICTKTKLRKVVYSDEIESYITEPKTVDVMVSNDSSPGRIGVSSCVLRSENPSPPCIVKSFYEGSELAFYVIFNQEWLIECFGHMAPVLAGVRDSSTSYSSAFIAQRHGVDMYTLINNLSDEPKSRRYIYSVIEEIAFKIQHLNNAGWVHGDLKPYNVVVTMTADGSPDVRLLDFEGTKQVGIFRDAETGVRLVNHVPFQLVTPMIRNHGIVIGTDDAFKTDLWSMLHMWCVMSFKILMTVTKLKFERLSLMERFVTSFVNTLSVSAGCAGRLLAGFKFFVCIENCLEYAKICAALDEDLRMEKNIVTAIQSANQDLDALILTMKHHPRSDKSVYPGQPRTVFDHELFFEDQGHEEGPDYSTTYTDNKYTQSRYEQSSVGQTKAQRMEEDSEHTIIKNIRLQLPEGIKKVNLRLYIFELLA